ncbi:MAG: peptidoglycan DD-metalloendopeptidase family protein [Paludibacteraceae bacterium]|nr:peptidoglycan DD-metalloendopeptidase family protein [Paludibacteraceae bacterium]
MCRYFFILCVSFFLVAAHTHAESINELKRKQQQAKQKIELTNRLLRETQKTQKTTVSSLTVLKKQITERENLISALNSEISVLDVNLQSLNTEKTILQQRLSALRAEYAKLVYHAYFFKHEYNKFLFIFSSESFSQAYRRIRYVQQYSQYRRDQTIQIQNVAEELYQKENQLVETKNTKAGVLQGKEVENQRLQAAKDNTQKMLGDLTKKEKDLRDQLKKQQKQVDEFNAKIQQLIAAEIAAAEKKAQAKRQRDEEAAAAAAAKAAQKQKSASRKKGANTNNNNANTNTNTTSVTRKTIKAAPIISPSQLMTKEEGIIAGGFEKNMGRLPWPVRGVITGHFGIQNHPVLEHVQINNKGIYIQTQPNSDACAVYEGEVTQVFAIPGNNNAIIVKHGIYRTVYANLTTTYVRVGAHVNARQRLGRIDVEQENNNKTELYFMLYKNSTLVNPEHWLAK